MYQYPEEIELFKALSHPARLAVLEILRGGEQCVCHMGAVLGQRQAYMSQQLMALRDAGLVKDRRDGWNIYYRVTSPDIYAVLDSVRKMTGMPAAKLVGRSVACTCPNCQEHTTHRVQIPVELQTLGD